MKLLFKIVVGTMMFSSLTAFAEYPCQDGFALEKKASHAHNTINYIASLLEGSPESSSDTLICHNAGYAQRDINPFWSSLGYKDRKLEELLGQFFREDLYSFCITNLKIERVAIVKNAEELMARITEEKCKKQD